MVNLHEEDIFVAVVAEHIVVDLCNDSISVLSATNATCREVQGMKMVKPVEESDVAGVDFVLVLD